VRFLLDTHALLWWLFDDARLSSTARGIVSDASAWEISTKHRLGRLDSAAPLLADLPGWLVRAGFRELPISVAHARKAGGWRNDHRDPFDRMLAAQSALEDVPLLSRDPELEAFGVRLVW
jgi:PIN domain nuclease of toxin-antitoxin system